MSLGSLEQTPFKIGHLVRSVKTLLYDPEKMSVKEKSTFVFNHFRLKLNDNILTNEYIIVDYYIDQNMIDLSNNLTSWINSVNHTKAF